MYTQEELEQAVDAATTESPSTAEGWLKQYNGNVSKCAEVLGLSNATLRKHRDNNTLSDILIYNGKVFTYKNDVNPVKSSQRNQGWEEASTDKLPPMKVMDKEGNWIPNPNIKVTRDPETGRAQYWKRAK
jgi:hypothetical protein